MPPTGSSATLRQLEAEWNARKAGREHFEDEAHPINLNIGKIEGGDWASSVPCWCRLDCRIAIYPGHVGRRGRARDRASASRPSRAATAFLANNPPQRDLQRLPRRRLCAGAGLRGRGRARRVRIEAATGKPLESFMSAAYLDTRVYALYDKVPALCYGPISRTSTASTSASASPRSSASPTAMALFIAEWCGVEKI